MKIRYAPIGLYPIAASGTFIPGPQEVIYSERASAYLTKRISSPSVLCKDNGSTLNVISTYPSNIIGGYSERILLRFIYNRAYSVNISKFPTIKINVISPKAGLLVGAPSKTIRIDLNKIHSSSIYASLLLSAKIRLISAIGYDISIIPSLTANIRLDVKNSTPLILTKGLKGYLWLKTNALIDRKEPTTNFVVLNAQTFAISEYTINAIDVVEFNGNLFILTPNTLLTLDSLGEEVVSSFIETGTLTLIPHSSFNIYRSVVDIQATTDVNIIATAIQDDNVKSTLTYPIPAELTRNNARRSVVKMSAGIVGNDWQFQLTSPDKPWELADWTIHLDRVRYRRFS